MVECGRLQIFGSQWWQVAGSCKYGIETSDPANMGVGFSALLDWLRNYLLLKTCGVLCSYISSPYFCFMYFYFSTRSFNPPCRPILKFSFEYILISVLPIWVVSSEIFSYSISTGFRLVPPHQLYSYINQFNISDPHSQPMLLMSTLLQCRRKQ